MNVELEKKRQAILRESVPFSVMDKRLSKKVSGVYFIVDTQLSEIVYIGQSECLKSRLSVHSKAFHVAKCWFIKIPKTKLNEFEAWFIYNIKPQANRNIPTNGRFMILDNIYKRLGCRIEAMLYYMDKFKIKGKEFDSEIYYDLQDFDKLKEAIIDIALNRKIVMSPYFVTKKILEFYL